jgi:hypothetical protein
MPPDRSRRSPTRYNSAVYASLVTNDYDVFLVNQSFLDGTEDADCVESKFSPWPIESANIGSSFGYLSSMLRNGSLERLERTQCITEYAKAVQPTRRNLLLVAANVEVDPNKNRTTGLPYDRPCIEGVQNSTGVFWIGDFDAQKALRLADVEDSYSWLCSGSRWGSISGWDSSSGSEFGKSVGCAHEVEDIRKASQWEVRQRYYNRTFPDLQYWRWSVDHCLSEPVTARCELHFSTVIAVTVTILNFCKSTT